MKDLNNTFRLTRPAFHLHPDCGDFIWRHYNLSICCVRLLGARRIMNIFHAKHVVAACRRERRAAPSLAAKKRLLTDIYTQVPAAVLICRSR